MTYQTFISAIESAEKCCKIASDKMKELQGNEKGAMGLTPDKVKSSPSFRQAKREYDTFFHSMRVINSAAPKAYLKRRRDEMKEKRLKERLIQRFKDEALTNEARKSIGEELYNLGVKRVSVANPGSGSCAFYSTK